MTALLPCREISGTQLPSSTMIGRVSLRLLLGSLTAIVALTANAAISVWLPRQGAAAFTEPGKTVILQLQAPAGLAAAGWSVAIGNDLRTWPCVVVSAKPGSLRSGAGSGWHLEVRVPAETPPELMDVTVRHSDDGAATAVRALGIVRDLEADFYLLHLTDEHVRDEKAAQSKEPANGYRTAELVRWATPVVNLINPRFVVNSGDLTFQYNSDGTPASSADLVRRYAEAKSGYRVPSLAVPGNHDVSRTGTATHDEAAARWEATLGPRAYALRIGSLYLVAHDFHDESLRALTATDYAASATDASIRGRIVLQHFAGYLEDKPDQAFPFRPDGSVPAPTLMLIGHVHMTRVEQASPFPVLMSVAAHRYARAGFVELKKDAAGNWACPSAATWGPESAFGLVGDHGRPMVSADFQAPNDGTSTNNVVTIRNDLPRRFDDGRVRFLMQPGTYTIGGGEKIAEYPYRDAAGSEHTAVLVKADLAPHRETRIAISRDGRRSSWGRGASH